MLVEGDAHVEHDVGVSEAVHDLDLLDEVLDGLVVEVLVSPKLLNGYLHAQPAPRVDIPVAPTPDEVDLGVELQLAVLYQEVKAPALQRLVQRIPQDVLVIVIAVTAANVWCFVLLGAAPVLDALLFHCERRRNHLSLLPVESGRYSALVVVVVVVVLVVLATTEDTSQ